MERAHFPAFRETEHFQKLGAELKQALKQLQDRAQKDAKDKAVRAPHVLALIAHFNVVSMWVASAVVASRLAAPIGARC